MLNFNQRVQQFLKQHRENKKHAVIAVMLALMVAFSVCGSLIMPAVSMTGSTEETAPALEMAESEVQMVGDSAATGPGIQTAFSEAPAGATNFGDKITKLDVNPEGLNKKDENTKTGDFTISYEFKDDSKVDSNQPYIFYKLPSELIIPADYAGDKMTVTDTAGWESSEYNTKHTSVCGYFCIDAETNLIVIKFTPEYCKYIRANGGKIKGTVGFEGDVKRSNTKDGDTTVEINGQKIHVEFDDQPPVISKNASVSGENAPEITWTVTLTNPGTTTNGEFESYTDLNGYTLEDVQMPSGVTVNPPGVGIAADGKFTFSEAANKCEKITFTYHRALTEEELRSGKLVNTATLKDTSSANVNQATAEASFATSKATIAKSGTPSYAIDGSKGYIEWTLTVQRSYGKSLKDYVVADDALAGATIIKATDRNGNDITSQIAVNGGKATIGAEVDYATITYRTAQTTNGTVSNHATVTPPDGNTPDGETDSSVKYDTSELFSVKKDGDGSKVDDISATWTVTLDSTGTGNRGTLNGYVLSDEAFARMIGDFTIVSAKKDGQYGSTQANVTFTKNANETYTVNGDANYLQFTYRARLSDREALNRLQYNWTEIENTIKVTSPDGDEKQATKKFGVNQLTNSVTKTLKSGSTKTDTGYYDKTNPKDQKETLSWEVTMDQYTKFSGGNKAYVDVMSATGDGEHYIIPKDAKIHVMAATGEKDSSGNYTYQVLTAGTDYTIQFYSDENHTQAVSSNSDKAKSYVVTFLDAVDNAGYTHMKITYETIADVTKVGQQDTDEGNKSTFSNKASFNGQDSSGNSYTFERKTPKTNLTAKKEWVQDDPDSRPKSITVQLFRRAGTSGDWVNIGEQALTSSNGYQYTWPDLLQCTNDENQTPYYYKIEEVVTDDLRSRYDVTYAYDPSGDGLKVQGQTNATLTVTNTWKNIKVSVNKQWIGDTAADRPDTIQVKLQQRIDGTTEWIDVSGQNALTMNKQGDSFTSASWTNLPKTDANGKTIYYRAVEVNPSENYTAEFDETGISATGGSIIKNTWNYLDLTAQKKWVGDEGHEDKRPASIEVKLQQKTANGTWEDVAEKDHQILTKQADGSFSTAIWSKLPKKDSNGSELSYRAVEVTVPTGYSETDDENGIRQSGTVTITNTYDFITISGKKEWAGDKESNRPDSITFQLQRKTGANGTWADVEGKKQELKKTGGFPEVSWTELPRMDENKNLYFYRVIESPVPNGYTASAWDETGSNQSKTFTITNTLKPPYSKSAIKWISLKQGDKAPNIEEVSEISPDDLENWKVTTVDINGTATECYVFPWELKLANDGVYDLYDTLPENAVLIKMIDESGNTIVENGNTFYAWVHYNQNNGYFAYNSDVAITYPYNGNSNCVHIDNTNGRHNIDYLIYCTAIPKSIVDDAIAANGSYQITNQIIKKGDTEAKSATLTIQETSPTPSDGSLLDKSYIDDLGDRGNSKSGYQLIINPEGKTLSSDSTLDISDVFQIVGYQPPGGTRTDGSDLVDAVLANFDIDELDADGNVVRKLSTSEYSYLVNTADDVKAETKDEKNYTTACWNGGWYNFYNYNSYTYQKGLIIEFEVEGTPGKEVSPALYSGATADEVSISSDSSTVYDANGKARIIITIKKDFSKEFCISTSNAIQNKKTFNIISSKLTTTTVTTKTTLDLTVPDEMPLKITYKYQLRANQKTVDLDAAVKKDGDKLNWPAVGGNLVKGAVVYLKNDAVLHTNTGDVTDREKENGLVVDKAGATSQTTRYPTIQKVDISDYSIGGLTATFKLAKYDTSAKQWVYATGFTEVKDSSSTSYEINYTDSATETVRDGKTYLPAAAADLNVDEKFNVRNLNSGTLYKLVETKAPKGYEKTGWVSAEATSLETLKAHTYYFVYDGSVPSGLENELKDITVSQITANGTVQIANNNLIDIGAEKSWSPVPENAESVELELWWSFSKSMDNAKKATADDLGMSSLNASAMLSASDGWKKEKIWTSLPNGKDGRPIYYFVKEVSYTIGGSTTVINADGTWNGSYAPVYVGNGLNKSGVVSISNTEGLMLRKVWKNSDGSEMQNPPLTEIGFKLYGIKDGTSTEIYTGTLKSADGWQMKVPDSVLTTTYDSFRIEEVLTDEQRVPLYGYVFSDTYNVVGNSGEITLINKDSTPTEVDVSVEKVWGDGNSSHSKDKIIVELYQTTEVQSDNGVSLAESGATPIETQELSASNNWTYQWTKPYKSDSKQRYYYYVVEKNVPDGYAVSYERTTDSKAQRTTITNYQPGSLQIRKNWQDSGGTEIPGDSKLLPESIQFEIYRKANVEDSSSSEFPKDISLYAFGDSITAGFQAGVKYSDLVAKKLGVTVGNSSSVGYVINSIANYIDNVPTSSYNAALVIAGTNDLINSADSMDTMKKNMSALIDKFASDKVIFIGSVPKFTGQAGSGSQSRGDVYNPYKTDPKSTAYLEAWDALVQEYNAMLKELVAEKKAAGKAIYFVDIYTAVGDSMDSDGIHPNSVGQQKIADAFVAAIRTRYNVSAGEKPPTNVNEFPSILTEKDFVKEVTVKPDADGNWTLSLSDLPAKDSDDNDYIYYVKEKSGNYSTAYTSNGQILGTSGATITVTNTKTIEKTSISVEKKWVDNDKAGATHGAVNVTLRRKLESGTDYDKGFSETAELSSSNGWTHTWSNLDKTDAGGNQYLYDVVEKNVPGGYQVTYKNNNGVNGNTAENPIVIVNTKVLQLTLKKQWSDSDTNNHLNDSVEVKIYRSTNPADVPVVTTATTKATTTTTTKATTTKATTKATTTTTTTTTSAKETKPEETTTTTLPKLKLTAADNKTELYERETLQLTVTPSEGVTFQSSNDEFATVDNTGLVTGVKAGTVTITAHKDGYEDATIQLTVKSGTLTVSVPEASIGKKFKFTVTGGEPSSSANGCYGYNDSSNTWSVVDGSEKNKWTGTFNANGDLELEFPVPADFGSGLQFQVWWAGDSKIPARDLKVTYTEVQATTPTPGGSSVVLTDVEFDKEYDLSAYRYQEIVAIGLRFNLNPNNSGAKIEDANGSLNFGGGSYNFSTGVLVDDILKIEISDSTNSTLKIINWNSWVVASLKEVILYYATDTSAQSFDTPTAVQMARRAVRMQAAGETEPVLVNTVTLKNSDSSSWRATLSDLPAYDEHGAPYYYWAVETAVGGYTPSYTYAGGADNYISGADGAITIINTKEESPSVTMPATGGRGTRWYTITGAAILCGTAAGYLWFRRRYLSRVE